MPKTSVPLTLSITTSLATTPEIPFSDQIVGQLYIPAGSSITSLTWYAAPNYDATYLVAYDAGTNGAQTVAAGRSYKIPVELAGARYLKAVGDAAGTIYVSLKS